MKKTTMLLLIVFFMTIGYAAYNATINIYGNALLAENLSDFKIYLSNLKVNGTEVSGINETKDEFTIKSLENAIIDYEITNDSTEYDTEAYLECEREDENVGKSWDFDYTGSIQNFLTPAAGRYKLEVWGAQGGDGTFPSSSSAIGGYGGYAFGNYSLTKNVRLFVVAGGKGTSGVMPANGSVGNSVSAGGYNGGGDGSNAYDGQYFYGTGGGGGATHISYNNDLLKNGSSDSVLIAAGGGGGASLSWSQNDGYKKYAGGSGGGYNGGNGTGWPNYSYGIGGSQSRVTDVAYYGLFGLGGTGATGGAGGGSGYYGGTGSRTWTSAGGGSGYIGSRLLSSKAMYCYNCSESSETDTRTVNTTCVNSNPTVNCAKSGNGYARITLTYSIENIKLESLNIESGSFKKDEISDVTAKSLTCKLKLKKISKSKVETNFNIMSGTGFNVGDEVCYNKECFYVYDYDGENVKMLSKYNLMVGRNLLSSTNIENIDEQTEGYGFQNKTMLGGIYTDKIEYPVNGEVFYSSDTEKGENYNSYHGSIVEKYVNLYKENLKKIGLNLNDDQIRLITKAEIDKLYNTTLTDGMIKDQADGYEWIYSTSYWTMTEVPSNNIEIYAIRSDSRISAHRYGYAYRGVRPVISIPAKTLLNSIKSKWNFSYKKEIVEFKAPFSGTYKLETWGAQGGDGVYPSSSSAIGGYGGYSTGTIHLNKNDNLFIAVGGKGENGTMLFNVNSPKTTSIGGYNGGGNGNNFYDSNKDDYGSGAGGGATHIATISGLLSDLENNKNNLLIVAGGGGGASLAWSETYKYSKYAGGSGGGFTGGNGTGWPNYSYGVGGNQTLVTNVSYNGSFGLGGTGGQGGAGGGGGFYGGTGSRNWTSAGGGSGYIGNSLLTEKTMYCYNCEESSEENTKTISTTCVNSNPVENCAKSGNGYARITLISN